MRAFTGILSVSLLACSVQFAVAQTTDSTGARPGNDIGTRNSLPLSSQASNISGGDTKSTIAPTPPLPNVGPNADVRQLLTAARQGLTSNQTGMAQEAMEQAESRILDRAVVATEGAQPSADPVVTQIEQARQALGNGDKAGSGKILDQILAGGAPELSD